MMKFWILFESLSSSKLKKNQFMAKTLCAFDLILDYNALMLTHCEVPYNILFVI